MPLIYTDALQDDEELSQLIRLILLRDSPRSQLPPPHHPEKGTPHRNYMLSTLPPTWASLIDGELEFLA